jgi:hypothetical protein
MQGLTLDEQFTRQCTSINRPDGLARTCIRSEKRLSLVAVVETLLEFRAELKMVFLVSRCMLDQLI